MNRGDRARVQTEIVKFISGVLKWTKNLVILRLSLAGTAKTCTKKSDARAELLFCSLNLLLFWGFPCRRCRSLVRSLFPILCRTGKLFQLLIWILDHFLCFQEGASSSHESKQLTTPTKNYIISGYDTLTVSYELVDFKLPIFWNEDVAVFDSLVLSWGCFVTVTNGL